MHSQMTALIVALRQEELRKRAAQQRRVRQLRDGSGRDVPAPTEKRARRSRGARLAVASKWRAIGHS
jgi:hypothetical protein